MNHPRAQYTRDDVYAPCAATPRFYQQATESTMRICRHMRGRYMFVHPSVPCHVEYVATAAQRAPRKG